MRKFLIIIVIFLFLINLPSKTYAKVLPQVRQSAKVTIPRVGVTGISVTPRFRGDRKALLVYFGNLQNATNVSYVLIYRTQGRDEGAGGSVRPSEGNSTSRELLFGTCSKNVCTYHQSITNMKLEVTGQLKSGKSFTKRYRIKI